MSALDLTHFIDGVPTSLASGDRISVFNPADPRRVVGTLSAGTATDVDRAVRAAARAQLSWSERTLEERCRLVKAAGEAISAAAEYAAPTLTSEMGKVVAESFMDFGAPGYGWSVMVDDVPAVRRTLHSRLEDGGLGPVDLYRRPVGVVGAIVPWNWPLALLGVKLGPALVAGNTVVAVPSPYASLAVLQAVQALQEVLPPGVVNVVTGAGAEVGSALVAHPGVGMVAFTGGVDVGREVAASAGRHLKPTVLELGGNDAAVLFDDVPVTDELIESMVAGSMMTAGQVCFAIKRLLVHRSLYDDVVSRISDALSAVVVGDGLDPEATMGPLANSRQNDRFTAILEEAERDGAKLTELGRFTSASVVGTGYFHLPRLVTQVSASSRIVQDEQFGPALPVLPFDTDEEAIDLVNGTPFGLTASLWSADTARARGLADRVATGVTFINQHGLAAFDARAPFGGTKQSGYGREMGLEGMREFTWTQQVNDRHAVM